MGSSLDRGADFCDAKLGNGVQEVGPCLQDSYVLWKSERTKTEKNCEYRKTFCKLLITFLGIDHFKILESFL